MSRRRPRGLSPEEKALWERVASATVPMHPARPKPLPEQIAQIPPAPDTAPEPLPRFRIGERATDTALPRSATPPPLSMDARQHARLTRGKLKPEARLDLHGMTLAEAHVELTDFILRARAQGLRLVLVITGKGRDGDPLAFPTGRGLLRRQVPHWLELAPLAQAVLQVTDAHQRHGGGGAYYVYLKRPR